MKVPVQGYPTLYRDSKSNAIINTDSEGLKAARAKKAREQRISETLEAQSHDINMLKDSMNEIKHLLQQILKQ